MRLLAFVRPGNRGLLPLWGVGVWDNTLNRYVSLLLGSRHVPFFTGRYCTVQNSAKMVHLCEPLAPFSCTPPAGPGWGTLYALPPGLLYNSGSICDEPDGTYTTALGRNHTYLSVTHVSRVMQRAWGLWLYHVPESCSDLGWNSGRTLLAKNRCDLAITLEKHANGGGVEDASERVAKSLLASAANLVREVFAFSFAREHNKSTAVAHLGWLLRECASGVVQCTKIHESGKHCDAACQGRSLPLLRIASHNALDRVSEALLRRSGGLGLDSAQLAAQPQGGGSFKTAVEIWDLRYLFPERQSRDRSSTPVYAWANGSSCQLSSLFKYCFACAGSQLERACQQNCHGKNYAPDPRLLNFIPHLFRPGADLRLKNATENLTEPFKRRPYAVYAAAQLSPPSMPHWGDDGVDGPEAEQAANATWMPHWGDDGVDGPEAEQATNATWSTPGPLRYFSSGVIMLLVVQGATPSRVVHECVLAAQVTRSVMWPPHPLALFSNPQGRRALASYKANKAELLWDMHYRVRIAPEVEAVKWDNSNVAMPWVLKLSALLDSPFERTLFLDSDGELSTPPISNHTISHTVPYKYLHL